MQQKCYPQRRRGHTLAQQRAGPGEVWYASPNEARTVAREEKRIEVRHVQGAERLIASKREELLTLDDEFFGEVIGVAQAIVALRKALNEISASLDSRQFQKASDIGYGKAAQEFVFLQRTLGGLQSACLHKEKLVSDLAFALRWPYEEVLPRVDAHMQSAHPLDRKQRRTSGSRRSRVRARIKAMIQRFGEDAEAGTIRRRRRRRLT
jgi:hypothetical protein